MLCIQEHPNALEGTCALRVLACEIWHTSENRKKTGGWPPRLGDMGGVFSSVTRHFSLFIFRYFLRCAENAGLPMSPCLGEYLNAHFGQNPSDGGVVTPKANALKYWNMDHSRGSLRA